MAHSILIVEDNAVMANLLKFNLKRAGFDVAVASNGIAGLELAVSRSFDVVITDHQMPGMTGVEMCKSLRQLPQYSCTPLLLCTAKGLELQRTTLQDECRITDVLFKPVSPRQMIDRVTELLAPAVSTGPAARNATTLKQPVLADR